MRLSRFPYVVQKEILDHLSINHLFFLSLCSKKTKNFLTQSYKYQLKKFNCVHYMMFKDEAGAIGVETVSGKFRKNWIELIKERPDIQESEKVSSVEKVRVNEMGIDFFRSTNLPDLHVRYCPENLESIIETIHKHLFDLLGSHANYCWSSPVHEIYILPIIANLQKIEIFGEDYELTKVEELLSRSTCLEFFSWNSNYEEDIEFRGSSKIYELDTVNLGLDGPLVTDVMEWFNGRHAFLKSYTINATHVIKFLNEWMAGEKYGNLEVISMGYDYEAVRGFNIEKIRQSVELKEVETEVEYSFYRKWQRMDKWTLPVNPCDFKTRLYMVRKSDGHVASVMLDTFSIFVGVWKMTENEFLERFR